MIKARSKRFFFEYEFVIEPGIIYFNEPEQQESIKNYSEPKI